MLELVVLMNFQYDIFDWTKRPVTTQYVRFYSIKHEIIQRQLFDRQEELPEEVLNSEYVRKYTNSSFILISCPESLTYYGTLTEVFWP